MKVPMPMRLAVVLSALVVSGTTLLTDPVQAQYGYDGGGYGGGYERRGSYDDDYEPRRSYDGGYDRRRSYDDDDDHRRGRRDDYDRRQRDDYDRIPRGGYDGSRGSGAPQARGGFVQSCRDVEQDGYYLSASCRMRGGGYTRSRIDIRSCRSIGNNDGRLVCE